MEPGPERNLGDDQDYSGLPDEELERAVREPLEADQTVDARGLEIEAKDGRVRLAGRVASEVERETAGRIVTDLVGLEVVANELRVEPAAREGTPAAEVPTPEVAYGEPEELGPAAAPAALGPGGPRASGADVGESRPDPGEVAGTEDTMEASDEGRSWTPPDAPWPEAEAATDPAHGIAADQPRPEPGPRRRGRRPPRADEAVARAVREAPRAGQGASENATSFKERMRDVAEGCNRPKDGES